MRKYEYQIAVLNLADAQGQLSALGADGWRVVQVLHPESPEQHVLLERDAGPRFTDIRSAAAHG